MLILDSVFYKNLRMKKTRHCQYLVRWDGYYYGLASIFLILPFFLPSFFIRLIHLFMNPLFSGLLLTCAIRISLVETSSMSQRQTSLSFERMLASLLVVLDVDVLLIKLDLKILVSIATSSCSVLKMVKYRDSSNCSKSLSNSDMAKLTRAISCHEFGHSTSSSYNWARISLNR